jgi:hypothetical protein
MRRESKKCSIPTKKLPDLFRRGSFFLKQIDKDLFGFAAQNEEADQSEAHQREGGLVRRSLLESIANDQRE